MGPLEVSRGEAFPTGIAGNATHLFWANDQDGTIVRCPILGCGAERTVMASGQAKPTGVAVDATTVYWVAESAGGFVVRRCPLAGCGGSQPTDVLMDAGKAWGIAVGAGALYLATGTRLLRCSIDGCARATPTVLVSGDRITGIAVSATHFYFLRMPRAADSRFPGLYRCPVAGCGPREVDEDQVYSGIVGGISLSADATNVYWTEYPEYWPQVQIANALPRIARCPLAGCAPYAPGTVAFGEIAPWGIAVIGDYFYWTDMRKGRVTRVSKPPR